MVMLIPAVFLALLGFSLSQESCPPSNLIKPCECTSPYFPVTYECKNITDQGTLENMVTKSLDYPMHALVMDKCVLQYMPADLIRKKNMSIVLISHSTLSSLFDEPLGSSYKMQMVQMTDSSIQRGIDWSLFKDLDIDRIEIERTHVGSIGAPFLENIGHSVVEITMDGARINWIHRKAFSSLTELETLALPHNNIKEVHRSMFAPQVNNLRVLDFSWNRIKSVDDDLFSNMPALTDVHFPGNRLKVITARVWKAFLNKPYVQCDVADNPIVCDCGIKWITSLKSPHITGKCDKPENLNNYNLNQLTNGDFRYCPK